MLFKSGLVTQGSGSLGGLTLSHNKGGYYFRARTIPTNPGTPYQSEVRQSMADLTSRWNNVLTPEQREAWEVYAENVPVINPLGDPILLTALNHYVRSNIPRMQAASPKIDQITGPYNLGEFTNPSFAASEATQQLSVTFDNTDTWAGEAGNAMLIYCSRPQNPTINYFKGPYRYAGKISGAATPPTSPATIAVPFAFVEDQRLFVLARVTRNDGRLSLPFRMQGDADA